MNPIILLDFIHHEHAFQRAQAVDGTQYVQNEFLVMLHVTCMDFQQVIRTSGDIVTLGYLRNFLMISVNSVAISRFSRRSFTLQNTTNP